MRVSVGGELTVLANFINRNRAYHQLKFQSWTWVRMFEGIQFKEQAGNNQPAYCFHSY